MRLPKEGEPADSATERSFVKECRSPCSMDLAGDNTYRLMGVISHYGGAPHSGHYVSDIYSEDRDSWFHYDDRCVRCVNEAEVLGERRQKNGYIFFYLHKNFCKQLTKVTEKDSVVSEKTTAPSRTVANTDGTPKKKGDTGDFGLGCALRKRLSVATSSDRSDCESADGVAARGISPCLSTAELPGSSGSRAGSAAGSRSGSAAGSAPTQGPAARKGTSSSSFWR